MEVGRDRGQKTDKEERTSREAHFRTLKGPASKDIDYGWGTRKEGMRGSPLNACCPQRTQPERWKLVKELFLLCLSARRNPSTRNFWLLRGACRQCSRHKTFTPRRSAEDWMDIWTNSLSLQHHHAHGSASLKIFKHDFS